MINRILGTILISILFSAILGAAARAGGSTGAATNENAIPLSPDHNSKRTVWVRNKDGKGIENVEVIVDYISDKHPPTFKTDSSGKAEVGVKAGFAALHVDTGGRAGIRMTIMAKEVEWPCEIILPTRKTKF